MEGQFPFYHLERSLAVDPSTRDFGLTFDAYYFSFDLDRAGVYGKGGKRKEREQQQKEAGGRLFPYVELKHEAQCNGVKRI